VPVGVTAATAPADAVDDGPCPAAMPLDPLVLTFAPRDEAGLDALLRAQLDPASPDYRRWLTPEEFGRRFGPPARAYARAARWLRARGFEHVRTWPGRLAIAFRGDAGRVEGAFGAPLRAYRWRGAAHHAPAREPLLPAFDGVQPSGLLGLDTFVRVHPLVRIGGSTLLAPGDVHTVFGLRHLYDRGITGRGVTLAVLALSDFPLEDVARFRTTFGLPASPVVKRFVAGNPGTGHREALGEVLLDTEWAGALAPGATILAVIGNGLSFPAIYQAGQDIVNRNDAAVVSVSLGVCEALVTCAVAATVDALARQAAAQGQSVLISSGDAGAAECLPEQGGQAVSAFAASPWVTGVGGTILDPLFDDAGDATGYGSEVVWNEVIGGRVGATGGGRSTCFAKPRWQAGPGVPADGARDVPDVAFAASPRNPGFAIIGLGRPNPFPVGGTSASAPVWAGFAALLVQQAGGRVGLLNPELYRLGALQALGQEPAVFHDVTVGNNSVPGTPGFLAGPGYDLVTGWGSFVAPALLDAFGTAPPPPPCVGDAECQDLNPCTTGRCTPSGCRQEPVADGTVCLAAECAPGRCRAGTCLAEGPGGCDDQDPCTVDACTPGGCFRSEPVGTAAVICVFPPGSLAPPACTGARLPRRVQRQVERAEKLIERAIPPRAEPRLTKAIRRIDRAARLVDKAGRNGRLSPECAGALAETLAASRGRAEALRAGP
jgi:hypothetical protein